MKTIPEFLKPKKSNLILPAIILFLLLFSSAVNLLFIPQAAGSLCAYAAYSSELGKATDGLDSKTVGADPEKIVRGYENIWRIIKEKEHVILRLGDELRPIFSANLYLFQAAVGLVDPFYPAPCDLAYIGPAAGMRQAQYHYTPGCRFYMGEEQYQCLRKGLTEGVLGYSLAPGRLIDLPFSPVSIPETAVHSAFVVLIAYVLSCLVFYLPKRSGSLPRFLAHFLVALAILFIIFSLLFNILIYSPLYSGSLALLNEPKPGEIKEERYTVVYCPNTVEYNSTYLDLRRFRVPEGYNDTILGCHGPICAEICRNMSTTAYIIELPGPKPACVCGW